LRQNFVATVATPFTFFGRLEGFTSRAALEQGLPPAFTHTLIGSGITQETFGLQVLEPFTPRLDLPVRRNGTIFEFHAATPEPASMLLVATGIALARVRSRRKR
jgi:hypothetical protein